MTTPEGTSPHPESDRRAQAAESLARLTGTNYLNLAPPPTDTQIAKAAEYGFDLSAQQKYYTSEQWADRNK